MGLARRVRGAVRGVASLQGDNPIKCSTDAFRSVVRRPSFASYHLKLSVIEEGVHAVKKIIVLVLVALGAFAVYRKIQADRAELDLWTEATAASEN